MPIEPKALARAAAPLIEPVLFAPVYFVMREYGVGGTTPPWIVFGLLTVGCVMQVVPVQRWLAGGDLRQRRVPRLLAHVLVTIGVIYGLGWGAVLTFAIVLVTLIHMRLSGPSIWRPAIPCMLAGIGLGQLADELGVFHSYLPDRHNHAIAALGALAGILVTRQLGIHAEQSEHAESTVRASEERFRALVQDSTDVITVVDDEGTIIYVSPSIERITGFRPEDMLRTPYERWSDPEALVEAHALFARVMADPDGHHHAELRTPHADGGFRWVEVTVRNLLDNPAVRGVVANYRDITERRAIQERLAYDANHDALTGLANRAAFLRGLEAAAAGGQVGVLFIDLDGFKQVNDTLGHDAGDGLIVAVAGMLRRSVLGADLVGRLGGDEFAVVLTGIESAENAVSVVRRILAEMTQPVRLAGEDVFAQASFGVAVSGLDPVDAATLLHHADIAMYSAKRRRTHSYQVYIDGLHDPDEVDAEALEEELRRAIGADQLRLQYQPIVALAHGDLVGVEALVRWEHPTRGLLGPLAFIPLAEQTGVINQLGEWVLEHACRQVRVWQQRLPEGQRLSLSVNLSPRQFEQGNLVDTVHTILRQTDFDPHNLVLEVTESALVDDEAAIPVLTALNTAGIRIALDDFGTGYSSLKYLTRLPVSILKIDRCFVAELDGTSRASAVAEAVVRLAQILHLQTVAEGIEDDAQVRELALMGCETGQGYHFARPLDADAIEALIDARAGHRITLAAEYA